jgi:hypothetical protein
MGVRCPRDCRCCIATLSSKLERPLSQPRPITLVDGSSDQKLAHSRLQNSTSFLSSSQPAIRWAFLVAVPNRPQATSSIGRIVSDSDRIAVETKCEWYRSGSPEQKVSHLDESVFQVRTDMAESDRSD